MNDYKSYICSNCGGQLELKDNNFVCKSCGSTFESNQLEKKSFVDLQLAKKEIQAANFSKAKKILTKLTSDTLEQELCDVYWNLMLCSNYVMFETDGKGEQFPSFFNISNNNILEDENYKNAIEFAQKSDNYDRVEIFSKLAKKIESARTNYLDISKTTKPFDIFICFKSSDLNGKSTQDKQLAMDIYNEFNGKYNVFFSEKTLQNIKSNCRDYEPNIYYGLYTAKVMLLLCSKKDYIESTWVKNEWSRFEKINSNGKKTIIPIFIDDFNPNDLPQELWHKQGIKNDIKLIDTLTNQLGDLLRSQEEIDRINALKKKKTIKNILIGSAATLVCFLGGLLMILPSLKNGTPINQQNQPVIYKKVNDTYVVSKTNKDKIGDELVIDQFYNNIMVTGIEDGAFEGLSNLKSLSIPNTIESIGFEAFKGLNSLETLKIPFIGSSSTDTTNSFLGYFFGATTYDKNAEFVPNTLKVINITNDETISTNTFYGLTAIEEVYISDVTSTIEKSAFDSANTALKTLEIPFVGKNLNSYETGSASKVTQSEIFGYIFGAEEYTNQELKIPNSLVTLKITKQEIFGSYSFYRCTHIQNIYIPATTTKMCVSAFNSCSAIKKIYYGSTIDNWCKIDFVSEKSHPFTAYATNYTTRKFYQLVNNEYSLVENITVNTNEFSGYSLFDIDSIKTITIESNVIYLDKGFFAGVANISNLTQITFKSITNWKVYSVSDKSNIKSITIPSTFEELKETIETYSSYYWEKG
ncbi:MAG: leucine-rich repeat protein [Clostridia bacterium]|nr:leucine-rich repeat protein [Clostridia bacterium]